MEDFKEEEVRLIGDKLKHSGMSGVKDLLQSRINAWRYQKINIAVVGLSGAGKSCLINAMRDLNAEDEGAAAVGVTETTGVEDPEIKSYPHPDNENIVFWDLPGVGTKKYRKEDYLHKIKCDTYDFYLIVTSKRFFETDCWLASEVLTKGMKCFFIRTHIDDDLSNDKKSHPRTFNRERTLTTIRKYLEENVLECVEKFGYDLQSTPIFLVSNFETHHYDFQKLKLKLVSDFPALKQEAILMSLSAHTKEMLERKKKKLAERIPKVALISAIGGLVPVPGVSAVVDLAILIDEYVFYRKQFGLQEESFRSLSASLRTPLATIKCVVTTTANIASKISTTLAAEAASEALENFLRIGVPIIGSLISAGISYGVTVFTLRRLLDETAKDGFKLAEFIEVKVRENFHQE